MPGYKWDPVVRVVPANGAPFVRWFADELTDVGSHTSINLAYEPDVDAQPDVNRRIRPVVYGLRPVVEIRSTIFSMNDQDFLADIVNALLSPREFDVFLSLDGGVVYRQVGLDAVPNPTPVKGKTVVGADFTIRLKALDLVDRIPAMMTDPGTGGELVQNGSFEQWTGGLPQGWSVNSEAAVVQNTVRFVDGLSSARVTKTGITANYGAFSHDDPILLDPGAWYRFRASARGNVGNVTTALAFNAQIWNSSYPGSISSSPFALGYTKPATGQSIGPKYATDWGLFNGIQLDLNNTQFVSFDVYFRGPKAAFGASDQFFLRLHGLQTQNDVAFYDAVSIYGPILRSGYATW